LQKFLRPLPSRRQKRPKKSSRISTRWVKLQIRWTQEALRWIQVWWNCLNWPKASMKWSAWLS